MVESRQKLPSPTHVDIDQIDLDIYDELLDYQEVLV
jgi:hypothetical protein